MTTVKAIKETTAQAKDLLPVTQAAIFLGIHRQTLWRWVKDGKITPVLIGNQRFFNRAELQLLRRARKK